MAHLKYLYSTKCLSEGQLHTKLQRINWEIFVLPLAPPQQESVAQPTPGLAPVVHLTLVSHARESQGLPYRHAWSAPLPSYLHLATNRDPPSAEIPYSPSTP